MKTDAKGRSTCPKGQERYETFISRGREYVQYDYRYPSGELFSCVAPTLEEARKRRERYEPEVILYEKHTMLPPPERHEPNK